MIENAEQRHFRSFDGTRISYVVAGSEGAPPMVVSNGLGGNISVWRHFIRFHAQRFRVYCWDYRGLFSSGPAVEPESYSIEHHARDLAALIEAERIESPVLVGWSMGVQVNIEHAARGALPRAIIALNGTPGRPFRTAFYTDALEPRVEGLVRFARAHWRRLAWTRPFSSRRPIVWVFIRAMQVAGIIGHTLDRSAFYALGREFALLDFDVYVTVFSHLAEHDTTRLLSAVDCPVLVLAGARDPFTPVGCSVDLASGLPDAELAVIPGATHFAPLEYPDWINERVERFLLGRGIG